MSTRTTLGCIATLLAASLLACGQEASDGETAAARYTACGAEAPCASDNPIVKYEINRSMRDGDFFDVPLDPTRKIQQITMIYDGRYSVPELDSQGQPRTNDEGAPRYKDGVYAHGFVVGADGSKQEVSQPKFVDAQETDNWHDLPPLSGTTLHVEFSHADRWRDDAAVRAANTNVTMTRVIVQYRDAEGLTSEVFDYDLNNSLRSNAEIRNGGDFGIEFDGTKEIYRVDVRWGDEKPRNASGQYVPGRATGHITVDGVASERRNVAAIETQVFGDFNVAARAGDAHRIAVHMAGDNGRVHWIKVFYR